MGTVKGSEAGELDIRIGGLIEHESERAALREIERILAADGRRAIVFANFEIESRQIDLLVALDGLALVIEAKSCTRAIRGGENGDWQVHLASGHWKDFRNPYRQALDSAFSVKNAASALTGTDVPYVNAALVFVPGIPPGSQAMQGNRKVSVIGEDGLRAEFVRRTSGAWSIEQWAKFADHLGLRTTTSVCAACNLELAAAEDRLRRYRAMFRRTYRDGESLVLFTCRWGGDAVSSDDVVRLVFERRGGVLLRGPSGCGKSMLAEASGVAFNARDGVAIAVQGKDFGGNVKELVDREARLLGARSGAELLGDARRLGWPILFIVDGYNECGVELQGRLTRGMAALADRYGGGVLVTSQVEPLRGDLLVLEVVEAPLPTLEAKVAIARNASEGAVRSEAIAQLLAAVSTGLEARLVGAVGADLPAGSSRYALFDGFARKRLGAAASDGIRVLSDVAAWLCERLAFSLSIREFDRLMDALSVSVALRRLVIDKGLLTLRGDRVSFPHEMFLDAFAAEAVVRRAAESPDAILKALAAPLHGGRKDLIIGAVDDESMLDQLLPRLEDQRSVRACLVGQCGRYAQEWADERCRRLWVGLGEEARTVRFRAGGKGIDLVEFDGSSLVQWSPCDRAFFAVFPERMADGRNLEEALDILAALDRRIDDESVRLHEETGMGRARLRSHLFAIGYVTPQRSSEAPGISAVCANASPGVFTARSGQFGRSDEADGGRARRELMGRELSPGQFHLILTLFRDGGFPASFLSRAISAHWKGAPYHLRLALMHAAAMRRSVENEEERAELVEKIEGLLDGCNPWLTPIVVDALRSLGALDEGARDHRTFVLEQIGRCLKRPTERESQHEAWGIYSAQFDHPYYIAYCEVVAELAEHDRKSLLEMASRGAKEGEFFVGALLLELASFADRDVGECIARWTSPPPADNRTMAQNDIYAFVAAHIALARLGCALPVDQAGSETLSVRALKACGAILYWCNRTDMDEEGRREACKPEVTVLTQPGNGAALDVLRECEDVFRDEWDLLPGDEPVVRSIVERFPCEAAAISRDAIADPERLVGYFRRWSRFDRNRILAFGIRVLESYGNSSDRALLRQYAVTREHGGLALSALRAIEDRMTAESESEV